MPLIVKDYEWEQTDTSVRITVPLKGVHPQKADVFSTDEYLKVSYPPFFFEVFLYAPVEDVKGKASVGNGLIVFSLVKKEGGIWESLQAPEVGDKDFMKRKREEAIEKAHQRAEEEAKKKAEERREQDRYALRQQMKMDEEEKKRVEDIKEQERERATRQIERWKEKQRQADRATITILDSDDDEGDDVKGDDEGDNNEGEDAEGDNDQDDNAEGDNDKGDDVKGDDYEGDNDKCDNAEGDGYQGDSDKCDDRVTKDNQEAKENIYYENRQEKCEKLKIQDSSLESHKAVSTDIQPKDLKSSKNMKMSSHSKSKQPVRGHKKDLFEKPLPEPRASGTIQVSFTSRPFRTAARESKAPEEEEWLKKVAQAGRAKQTAKDNPDAIGDEEMNPIWLKDKGMGFYKSGNYVAAINAFTAALVLDGSVPSLYSNRAACHLHLKQYRECAQDCTSALELLTPPVPANAASRCKAHVRRGTAAYRAEEYVEALKDYESALKIDPKNESLRADAEKIRAIIQGTGT